MKRLVKVVAMIATMALPTMAVAQDTVEATVGADIVSKYIWRGQDMGGANAAVQPTLGVSYKGISLTAWGSYGLMNNSNADFSTQELDLTLAYSTNGFNIGLSDYFCICDGSDPRYFYFKEGGEHVLEANIGYDFGPVAFQWFTNISGTPDRYVDKDGDLKHIWASYFEFTAPFKLGGLDWAATVGAVPFDSKGFYADANGFAVVNMNLKASKEIKITDSFSLPVFGQVIANPSTQKAYFVAGFSLGI